MMPRVGAWLVLAAGGLFVAGCGRTETNVAAGNRAQILHIGNGAEPTDLDPDVITGTKEFAIVSALYEGLASVDPVDSHPTPAAAERWDISADGRVYTFHLRPGLQWSNGDPLTAEDFVFAWHRVLDPGLAAEFSYLLDSIAGAHAYNKGETTDFSTVGVHALDPATLQVTLVEPTPYFLNLLRSPPFFPVQRAAIETAGPFNRRGTGWTRPGKLVGNGPFTLTEWTNNKVVAVAKNPRYWDAARVRLQGIRFYPMDSLDTEERAFRAGQLHKTYGVPFAKIDVYKRNDPALLRLDRYARTQYLALNCQRPPLDNADVRRALGLAIDREALVKNLTRGGERAAYSLVPPELGGYTAQAQMGYDPETARGLLAHAGYPGGKGMPAVELLFNTSEANRVIAEAVQQMWRQELGVEARLSNQEWKVYLNRRTQQDYQIYEGGWTTFYLDPMGFLELFVGGSIINQTGWANSEYDGALAASARALDPASRLTDLQRAEDVLAAQAPIIPLYHHTRAYLLAPAVQGWSPNLIDDHPYKYVFLKQ